MREMMKVNFMNELNLKCIQPETEYDWYHLNYSTVRWITEFKKWWELKKVWERNIYEMSNLTPMKIVAKSDAMWEKINVIAVMKKEWKRIHNGFPIFKAVIFSTQ